ncbi:DUF2637 domain-containing protein [Allonocardiopsis opalescens]|uniref:DUF2637 domain-containing protein n=1 Tax=Allonocardiopsis opalescens TaxID=1144618 RepID=UPI001FEAEF36
MLLLASIATVVSYAHMYELALRHGEPSWRAALFPLSVDGMIVASSMVLLDSARSGRRGGWLPWTLLIVGSIASLAVNVAVAEPDLWSQVIHAWPSFALACAYELLMQQFRVHARDVRSAYADPTELAATMKSEKGDEASWPPIEDVGALPTAPPGTSRPELHVLQASSDNAESTESDRVGAVEVPRVQLEAWRWALDNRRPDGTLPTGKEIAAHFDHQPRWGRLIKQWGHQGRFDLFISSG